MLCLSSTIVEHVGTPTYVYSLKRVVANIERIRQTFRSFDAHIHYSAKANNNLSVLRTVVDHGAGIDCVSAGEIYKALKAGRSTRKHRLCGRGQNSLMRFDMLWSSELAGLTSKM